MSSRFSRVLRMTTLCSTAALLSGCAQIQWVTDRIGLTRSQTTLAAPITPQIAPPAQRRPLGHDMEAPEAFQVTGAAVWDGRPTFGEVWIAVPEAIQPERVIIRDERTGTAIRGGMFAGRPGDTTGPIRLSSGAAAALGVEMGSPVTLTVTALRRSEPEVADSQLAALPPAAMAGAAPDAPANIPASAPAAAPRPAIAKLDHSPSEPIFVAPEFMPAIEVSEAPREVATTPPALYPAAAVDDGYIEVAQAITSEGAQRVVRELTEAQILAEIQEDFVDGQAYYRVFARRKEEEPNILLSTLSDIQFTAEAEGSDDGTVVAEMPNLSTHPEPEATGKAWVEFGAYPSRNEAMAVTQRLARRGIPSQICGGRQGLLSIHRVFAGPAGEETSQVEAASFCAGVTAAVAARPAPEVRAAMAPARLTPSPADPPQNGAVPTSPVNGPVRIRVGEATGDLRIIKPERISPPHRIEVDGVAVLVPAATPPELLASIRAALAGVDADQ